MTEPTLRTQGVVYVLDVADRPGLVHAIAAVFAHRGLSMRALVSDTSREPARILVRFRGTPRQTRLLQRVLVRLHDVHAVRTLEEESPALRGMALCRPTGAWPELAEVEVQTVGETRLLSGRLAAVEAALQRLEAEGLVADVARALLAL